jgi:hypothetical protein
MKFPTMVYRCPGTHHCPGGTFDYLGVKSQAELDAAIEAGWSRTMPEAMGEPATAELETSELEVLGDDAPPTRAELEKQAIELGIKFKKNTSDEELMGWTKRQFVTQAFEEIGYASYAYDLQPEQLQSGLRRLEAMIATWNGRGIRLGYPLSANPDNANLDDATQVPDASNEAIYANLAIRIAPIVGKTVSAETKRIARSAYTELLSRCTKPNEMQFPHTMPSGAGNKPWRIDTPFLQVPDDPIDAGEDGELNFN